MDDEDAEAYERYQRGDSDVPEQMVVPCFPFFFVSATPAPLILCV